MTSSWEEDVTTRSWSVRRLALYFDVLLGCEIGVSSPNDTEALGNVENRDYFVCWWQIGEIRCWMILWVELRLVVCEVRRCKIGDLACSRNDKEQVSFRSPSSCFVGGQTTNDLYQRVRWTNSIGFIQYTSPVSQIVMWCESFAQDVPDPCYLKLKR